MVYFSGACKAVKYTTGLISEPIDLSAPVAGTAPVLVAPAVAQQWNYLYHFIREAEFVLCLEGRQSGGVVHVDGFRLAKMIEAGAATVRYEPCETANYVGTAHNHPPASGDPPACYRLVPDRKSFEEDKKALVDLDQATLKSPTMEKTFATFATVRCGSPQNLTRVASAAST